MLDIPLKRTVRARAVLARGPYDASPAEVAALHALIYPEREAVCQTCPGELGKAYYAIKRWLDQQDNSPSTSTSSTVSKNTSTARFHSDTTTLFPHGLGVAYTNDNLTDKAARYILKNDPDAAQFFKVLPPDAEEGEDEVAPVAQPAPAESAPAVANGNIDYAKLAAAIVDEQERRQQADTGLTASAGGAPAADSNNRDGEHDDKPLPLSRLNKDQLVAAYRTELKAEPPTDMLNDDLRAALASHRAGQQDPE